MAATASMEAAAQIYFQSARRRTYNCIPEISSKGNSDRMANIWREKMPAGTLVRGEAKRTAIT